MELLYAIPRVLVWLPHLVQKATVLLVMRMHWRYPWTSCGLTVFVEEVRVDEAGSKTWTLLRSPEFNVCAPTAHSSYHHTSLARIHPRDR